MLFVRAIRFASERSNGIWSGGVNVKGTNEGGAADLVQVLIGQLIIKFKEEEEEELIIWNWEKKRKEGFNDGNFNHLTTDELKLIEIS